MVADSERTRLLITGATGFVGGHCLAAALNSSSTSGASGTSRAFDEIIATSRSRRTSGDSRLSWHPTDLLADDPAELIAETRPTHLLHLAWEATPGEYWTSPLNETWREASVELIRSFSSSPDARRVVVSGTCAEYDWSSGVCHEFDTPLAFDTPYARAKNDLRSELCEMGLGDKLCWARLFFVFGPNEPRQKLVSYVTNQLLDNETAECGGGNEFRDFIYIKDAAEALLRLLHSTLPGPVNIASGEAIRVSKLVDRLSNLLGRPDLVHYGKSASDTPKTVQGDCRRLRDEVGFDPTYSLDEALLETIQWWKSERKQPTSSSPFSPLTHLK